MTSKSISLFESSYGLPHNVLPFDKITTADIKPAILEGIAREKAEINAIVEKSEPATFENTIVAFEHAGAYLDIVTTYMYNRLSADSDDELETLAEEMSPILSEHSAEIMHNERLFARISAVKNDSNFKPSTQEDATLLDHTYDAFVRAGIMADDASKKRLREVKAELSRLSLAFSRNHLKETNGFYLHITDETQLKGLPQMQISQAAEAAKEKGLEGWVVTLHAPSYQPFMTYAENRQLRQQLYVGYNTQCTHDNAYCNFEVVRALVNLRLELAQILGFDTYADFVLKQRMAGNADNVMKLLGQLRESYAPVALKEVADVAQFARDCEVADFVLQPWDFPYYSNKLKKSRFDIDPEDLRPYFELNATIKGVFGLAELLYGITFKENKDIPVYHKDVTAYEVFDENGDFLAVFYTDFYPRPSKQSGAWMTSYKEESEGFNRPHVAINTNFAKPSEGIPTLLTLAEVETLLHETGHALHGIFAKTKYRSLSGTNVYWDFVELPSQFMENYATEPQFLQTFAKHYKTGEPLPEDLIWRVRASRNFNTGYYCMRQVSFALLDMAYYSRKSPLDQGCIADFEREVWNDIRLLPDVPGTNMSVQFGHIMSGGYAAGYYSYKWAEVLDADAYHYFKENGVFNKHVAQHFRNELLSRGGTLPPDVLYRNFRGRDATIAALLERDGIKSSAAS